MKPFLPIIFILFISGAPVVSQTPLSLEDYKSQVLDYNQQVQIARQTLEAAKSALKEVKTGYYPGINASGSYQYNFNPQELSLGGLNLALENQNWQVGADLRQNIYTGGKLSGTVQMAGIMRDIAALETDLSVYNIAYTAESAYWNTVASQAYVTAARKYLSILTDLLNTVQTRFDDGYISKTDLLKMKTSVKEAELQLSRTEQAYQNNCIVLNILMGEDSRKAFLLTDSIALVSIPPEPVTPEEVLSRRPEYLIKSKEIDFQQAQGKTDQSEFLPKLDVGASAAYGSPLLNLDNEPIVSPILYAQLSVPVFHWGKSRQVRNKSKAMELSRQYALSLTEDNIKQELATAVNNIAESSKQIDIARENLKVADESLDLHTFSYQEGRISILDVQSAQLSWIQASVNLINSYLENKISLAVYKKVIASE